MRASLAIVFVLVGCKSEPKDPAARATGTALAPAGSAGSGERARAGSAEPKPADDPAGSGELADAPAGSAVAKAPPTLRWTSRRATSVDIGPFTVAIPRGWRDTAELENKQVAGSLPAYARGLMPETLTHTGFGTNIVLQWTPSQEDMPCQQIADVSAQQSPLKPSGVRAIEIEGDRGCRWEVTADVAEGFQVLRFHEDHLLLVQVLYRRAGDPAAVAAFEQVLGGLRKRPAAKH